MGLAVSKPNPNDELYTQTVDVLREIVDTARQWASVPLPCRAGDACHPVMGY
jgi:hypothetical protein